MVAAAAAPVADAAAAAAAPPPLPLPLPLRPSSPPPPPPLFAVAAVAARLPGSQQADDAVHVVPLSRWDADDGWFDRGGNSSSSTAPPPLPKRFGAFLEKAALFDARCFSLSSAEAAALDPQQRLLLECGAEALARAPGMEGELEKKRRKKRRFFSRLLNLTLKSNPQLFSSTSVSTRLIIFFLPPFPPLRRQTLHQTLPRSPSPWESATQSTTSTPPTQGCCRRCLRPRARCQLPRAGCHMRWV